MFGIRRSAVVIGLCVSLSGGAFAQTKTGFSDVQARKIYEQTLESVRTLSGVYLQLADQRAIAPSDRYPVRESIAQSQRLFDDGDIARARQALDITYAAIKERLIAFKQETTPSLTQSGPSQMAVKTDGNTRYLSKQFEGRKETIAAFLETYLSMHSAKDSEAAAKQNADRLSRQVDQASLLFEKGRYGVAQAILSQAYTDAKQLLLDERNGQTIVKELKLDTPKDEYVYELDRHDSYLMILDMVEKEKPVTEKVASQIAQLKKDATQRHDQAGKLADGEKYEDALDAIMAANKLLIDAIRSAGLFIPG